VPPSEIIRFVVAAVATGVLIFAAISDIRFRRIPNWTVLALLGLFIPWSFADGGASLVSDLEAAAIAFAISFALYAIKALGAGDSKLFAACALFAGMGYLPYMALLTALIGGLISVVSLVAQPRRAMALLTMRGKGDWGRGVPYGVAVAAGAALVTWGGLTGLLDPFGYFNRHFVTVHSLSSQLAGHKP
jgi:prepilin peptidase CpaA